LDPLIAVRSLKEIAKLWVFSGASTQFNSGDMPSPKALPSQLNSAGSEPFTSNEGLVISNALPEEELEEDEELLDEELLELEEELLEEELLELEEELLELAEELLEVELDVPPQPAIAAASSVTLHANTIFFMVVSHL
jgi:hypothetical protein